MSRTGVQNLRIPEDEGEQRLDRWLRKRFPQLTQGMVEKFCRKGQIRLDGARVKPATRIESGQEVRIPPLPAATGGKRADPAERVWAKPGAADADGISATDRKMIQSTVLFRDQHIIAINKPPGLPSQGGSGLGNHHVDGLAEALKFEYQQKPKLVHRLDRDTSGLLLLARTNRAARRLSAAFRDNDVRKIYWAAIAGVPSPKMGTIRFGLLRSGDKMQVVHPRDIDATPGTRRATTDYAVIEAMGTRLSWCALVPITGRTHQLRAHMAGIGHPIVGDGKYGGSGQEKREEGWGAGLGGELSQKLHLHARSLHFMHPVTGKPMTITAPLPAHMAESWDSFGWHPTESAEDPFEELS